jgi:hypothetical protein
VHSFFAFCFGFSGVCVYAGSCGKAERQPETRHDCAVFFDRIPGELLKPLDRGRICGVEQPV